MAKLIRCPAGHIYDSAAHEACPECARTGVPRAAEDWAQVSEAARGAEGDSSKGGGEAKHGIPLTWLIGGGAAAVILIAAAIFLLRPSGAPVQQVKISTRPKLLYRRQGRRAQTSTADPKSDPDYGACEKASGGSIVACDRAIASRKFAGADLGALYRYRGFAKSHAEKPDLDAALADYGEAVRLEPRQLRTLHPASHYLCRQGGEQELAIKDYDRAIELSPRADFYNNRSNALRKNRERSNVASADLDQAIKLDAKYLRRLLKSAGLPIWAEGDKKEKAADGLQEGV